MNILGMGLPELIVIALIVLLFFGKDRLPGLFRSIGTSIRELKDGLTGADDAQKNTTPASAPVADPAPLPTSQPAPTAVQHDANDDEPQQSRG